LGFKEKFAFNIHGLGKFLEGIVDNSFDYEKNWFGLEDICVVFFRV